MTQTTESTVYKVCIITSTRADWGLLRPLASVLSRRPDIDLQIIATNMHLLEKYGMTADEITADGFSISARVPMTDTGSSEASRVRAMAQCLSGMADALAQLRPDAVIVLGDRYEIMAATEAAAMMQIPIIHIAGGEISEGAVDDCIRHAITKFASLHLTATEQYRRRVIQLGEQPDTVYNTGAIGVWNAMNMEVPDRSSLEQDLDFSLAGDIAVVTLHPATNEREISAGTQADALLKALDRFPELRSVITYPNNDARSDEIIERITAYAQRNPDRVCLVKSLGQKRYLGMLRVAKAVIGNSSSGIVEVPSAGIPTVDIGIRQQGRLAAPSVIHCGSSADEITAAIASALSPDMQTLAARRENPYYKPDTLSIMEQAITDFLHGLPYGPKRFFNILSD